MPTRAPHLPETTLGGRLRRAREAAGLTREEVAVRSGLGFQSISSYELGRVTPSLASLVAVAEACNTTCGALLDGVVDSEGVA